MKCGEVYVIRVCEIKVCGEVYGEVCVIRVCEIRECGKVCVITVYGKRLCRKRVCGKRVCEKRVCDEVG